MEAATFYNALIMPGSNNKTCCYTISICKESNPFWAKTEQYLCLLLNSKVHPGYIVVKGEKELNKGK